MAAVLTGDVAEWHDMRIPRVSGAGVWEFLAESRCNNRHVGPAAFKSFKGVADPGAAALTKSNAALFDFSMPTETMAQTGS